MISPCRRHKGFTLVELLIVMLIVSLGVSLVGGFSVGSYAKFQVTAETKQLAREIQNLRRRAYLTESVYRLNFSDNQLQVVSPAQAPKTYVFSHISFEPQAVQIGRFGNSDQSTVSYFANQQIKELSIANE